MQGTLDLLILKTISLEPMHAWGIGTRIGEISGNSFQIGQGSVYPAVRRLETRGLITSLWRTTDNNRIARYYELTPAGRHALNDEIVRWRKYTSVVDLVIEAR
jgi:transcriptional regulator, Acidobacterial, PadR-family